MIHTRFPQVFLIILSMILMSFVPAGGASSDFDIVKLDKTGPQPINEDGLFIMLRNRQFDPLDDTPILLANADSSLFYSEPTEYQLVQFKGPVLSEWKTQVEDAGGTLLQYIPDYTFIAEIPLDQQDEVQNLDCVRWSGAYHPYYKLQPGILEAFQFDPEEQKEMLGEAGNYTVTLFHTNPTAIKHFKKEINDIGGSFLTIDTGEAMEDGLAVVRLSPEQVKSVALIPGVAWIQPAPVPELHNYNDAKIVKARQAEDGAWKNDGTSMWSYDPSSDKFYGYTGTNVTIAVVDTGIDGTHPAFDGRKANFFAYNWAGQWQDVHYHGTHVAGTSLGNGRWRPGDPSPGTTGKYAGIAPNASLIGQAYLGSGYSVKRVMSDAASNGADISTNSWGYGFGSLWFGVYDNGAAAYDSYVRDSVDGIPVTILFSAGNDGSGSNTITPPATAKNIICVGSTDDNNGRSISGFSSRGPVEDGRMKPDILAPGHQVTSAFANNVYSYVAFSGTSMAAPGVAGGAAVVINYYQVEYDHNPSPALVKAVLLNGAEPMPGYTWPDNNQGWGRMDLVNSLLETPHKKYLYYDQVDELKTNEEVTYEFNVAEESKMKIHLVWTDKPGNPQAAKALINDLDLIVKSPTGDTYLGNQFYLGQSIPGGSADNTNNVEGFALNNPGVGEWEITVRGANVPNGPQDFAIIVSGPVWEDILDVSTYDLFAENGNQVFKGEDVKINCSIKNTGTLKFGGSQYVLTDYLPGGGSRRLLVSTVNETPPGGFFNFSLDWIADHIGTHRLVFSLDPLDAYIEANETNNLLDIYIEVHEFGVRLENPQPQLELVPGQTKQLKLQVHNKGTVKDNYKLGMSNIPPAWAASLNTSNITVPVGTYRDITLSIKPPPSERAGYVNGLMITVNSSRAPEYSSEQSLSFKVGEVHGFELNNNYIDTNITSGESSIYNIGVRNTGNCDLLLEMDIQTDGLSEGWKLSFSTKKLIVPYDGTANFTVTLSSPKASLAGHVESIPISLTPDNYYLDSGNPTEPAVCTVNATVLQYYDFELELETSNMEIHAGKVKRLDLRVLNNGNGWDTFEFDLVTPSGWGYSFEPDTPTIEAFSEADVRINLKVPSNTPAGTYEVALESLSRCDITKTCGMRLSLAIQQDYSIELSLENQIIVVPVGSSYVLPIQIDNKGNGDDKVSIKVDLFQHFVTFTDNDILVPPGGADKINAVIHIPASFSPSNHTINFVALSEDGETAVSIDVLFIITPSQKHPLQDDSTNKNESGLHSQKDTDEEKAGLFSQGYYYDIFIIILILTVLIIVLFLVMVSIDKRMEKIKAQKTAAGPKTAIATAAARGAASPGGAATREVKVVRKKREIKVIRKQMKCRNKPPALPEGAKEPGGEVPVIDAELAEECEEEEEAIEQGEHEVEQPPSNGGVNGGNSCKPLISYLMIIFIIISGFGAFSISDWSSETASAQSFQGNIYSNTTWSENVTLTGHTTVRPGAVLNIEAGVNVWFSNGVRLYIAGTLYANGTEDDPVNFTSIRRKPGSTSNPWRGIWNRIQFNSSGTGRLNYCNIQWAAYGVIFNGKSGSHVKDVSIENSTFANNRNGIYLYDYTDNCRFVNNTIYDNGWGYGIYVRASSFNYFERNNLTSNRYNFFVTGWNKDHFSQIFKNDTNMNEYMPMYYWVGRTDEVMPEDAGFAAAVDCTNVTIKNITAKKGGEGIVLAYSTECLIESVTVKDNNYGIYLYRAGPDNRISNVTSNSNNYGLYLHHSHSNILRNNKLQSNKYNIYVVGWNQYLWEHDIDTSNKVDNNKPIYYLVNEVNQTVPSNAGYVGLSGCRNITISGVDLRKNGQGLLAAYSTEIKIDSAYLYKNYYGTYFFRSDVNLSIENSDIVENSRGSYYYQSDDTFVINTKYERCYDAFWVRYSDNLVVDNSSIIAANRWNLNIESGSTVTLKNASFNPNKIRTVHSGTKLTVKWFLNIRALDDLGTPASCRVWVRDGMDNVVANEQISGVLNYVECIGYQQVPGLVYYQFNNYSVEARNATSGIVREINMTYSRSIEFIFNSKPAGAFPDEFKFDEDGSLELDLTDYFSDANKLTYATYIFPHLEVRLDNSQQTANITATPNWCGTELITIRVIDTHGEFIESTSRITVKSVNDAPYFTQPVPNIHLPEGESSYKFDLEEFVDDPDYEYCIDSYKWYIEGEDTDSVAVIGENSSSSVMELRITDPDYTGSHKLELYIEDTLGGTAVQPLWLNITERNDAPVLTDGWVNPNQGNTEMDYEFRITYTDIEGDLPSTVLLVLDNIRYAMAELNRSDRDTTDGKIYYYVTNIDTAGDHRYYFSTMDVYSAAGYTAESSGPYIVPSIETTGGISGSVIDERFKIGIANAELQLYHSLNRTAVPNGTVYSDSHGNFQYKDLIPGFYTIEAESELYFHEKLESILVSADEITSDGVVIEMRLAVPPGVIPETHTGITDVEFNYYFKGVEIQVGDEIIFNGSASDADGDTLIYIWDFGDFGEKPLGPDTTYNYTMDGNYTVMLTVLDEDGNSVSITKNISVKPRPVVVQIEDAGDDDGKDLYGDQNWLIFTVALLALLILLIPWIVFYNRRKERAKKAEKKLRILKKQVQFQMSAAASAQQLQPITAELAPARKLGPTPTPKPALPPTPVPIVEADVVEEESAGGTEGRRNGEEEGEGEAYECPDCGTAITEADVKCPSCGVEFEE